MKFAGRFNEDIKEIFRTIDQHGKEIYLVGGAVRDMVLGISPKDYDFATDATPDEIISYFERTNDLGKNFGTIQVLINHVPYEVTTYRKDENYQDGRRPENVIYSTDVKEDVIRRDFTINGLLMDEEGNIIDYTGGLDDMKKKQVSAIGDPVERFIEDKLRKLRCFRFMGQLNFDIEEKTYNAIVQDPDLTGVSAERIAQELNKIILCDNPERTLWALHNSGLLKEFLPEVSQCEGIEQSQHHKEDVLTHTFAVVNHTKPELLLRMAALLHDLGKACTMEITGFPGHAAVSSGMAWNILTRLKYPKKFTKDVCDLIALHSEKSPDAGEVFWKHQLRKLGKENIFNLFLLQIADCQGKKPDRIVTGIEENISNMKYYIENNHPVSIKELDINGNDLMALGYKGTEIKSALDFLLEYVLVNPDKNEKETLKEILKGSK